MLAGRSRGLYQASRMGVPPTNLAGLREAVRLFCRRVIVSIESRSQQYLFPTLSCRPSSCFHNFINRITFGGQAGVSACGGRAHAKASAWNEGEESMRRRPMGRTDRLLFMQILDQTRTFAEVCEEGELHASPLRRGCEELLISVDSVMSELAEWRERSRAVK